MRPTLNILRTTDPAGAVADGLGVEHILVALPETRARVVGYLATAPSPLPGFRTDGVWIWPAAAAELARAAGVVSRALFDDAAQRDFLLPPTVAESVLADAADLIAQAPGVSAPNTLDPIGSGRVTYLAAASAPRDAVVCWRRRADGSVTTATFDRYGWHPEAPLPAGVALVELPVEHARSLLPALCEKWHAEHLRRGGESEAAGDAVRLARMFDSTSGTGEPQFSPNRLRILEPARRERIVQYLRQGRLVMRATSGMLDPLEPGGGAVVPLGFRTDGTWVWQEGIAHYVADRGVAPELALLTHIEQRAYTLPRVVPDAAVAPAVAAVKRGPRPRPPQPPFTYYRGQTQLLRAADGDLDGLELLGPDLRWRSVGPEAAAHRDEFEVIGESEATRAVDGRWFAHAVG